MSTLDHLTEGRIGWNIVTSYLNSGARNVGLDAQVRHGDRYEIADEYLEVAYKLWEGSWEDDAVVRDRRAGVYTDPAKVHPIEHDGKLLPGAGDPHGRALAAAHPAAVPGGASSTRGRRFAAEHAEAVFITEPTAEIVAQRVADIRDRARAAGREPSDVKVFTGFGVVTGPTPAEAQRKYDLYRRADRSRGDTGAVVGLARLRPRSLRSRRSSGGRPESGHPSLGDTFGDGDWKLRDVIDRLALRPDGPVAVGTAGEVADRIQEWLAATDADGLNLWHVITPGSYVDFVEYVVPELQRRGVYRTEYEPGTLRDKLFGRGSRLPGTHPAARHRRQAIAER